MLAEGFIAPDAAEDFLLKARLQPYVVEAATLCARGCNPM